MPQAVLFKALEKWYQCNTFVADLVEGSRGELCYAASEAPFEGEAFSTQSCIRARNRRDVFGGIEQGIPGRYAVRAFGAADCRVGSGNTLAE